MSSFEWVQLKKGGAFNDGRHRPKIKLSVSSRSNISKSAYQEMGEPEYAIFRYDQDANAICVEPQETEVANGYRVSSHRGTAFSSNTVGLANYIPAGIYEYKPELGKANEYIFILEANQ